MPAEAGFFEAFYASPLQHPILLWLAAAAGTALCLARRDLHPSVRRYCLALGALSLADAWLTTHDVFGLGRLEGTWASTVPLFFVLAGDLRYLLFVFAADPRGRIAPDARSLARAGALTIVVPLFSQCVMWLLPDDVATARVLFLTYEVSFVALTLSLLRLQPNARETPWVRRVSHFVVLYYGLWAGADAILLTTGSDLGFALRVVPNVLYYGGLIAVIGRLAPTAANDG